MSGHRQAALALHTLSPRDQGLILAELPETDQDTLRTYLAELKELGFDGTTIEPDAIAPLPPIAVAPVAAGRVGERLRAAGAERMLTIIGDEPASLIAAVLAIDSWPWAADFLDLLAPNKRSQVRSALDAGAAPAPARSAFLLDAVGAAIGRTPAASPGVVGTRLTSLFSRVTAWAR